MNICSDLGKKNVGRKVDKMIKRVIITEILKECVNDSKTRIEHRYKINKMMTGSSMRPMK